MFLRGYLKSCPSSVGLVFDFGSLRSAINKGERYQQRNHRPEHLHNGLKRDYAKDF